MGQMMELQCANFKAYVDFLICETNGFGNRKTETLVAVSLFNRSFIELKAMTANLSVYESLFIKGYARKPMKRNDNSIFRAYFSSFSIGYEKLSHGVVFDKNNISSYLFVTNDEKKKYKILYNHLMNEYSFPLLEEWSEPIFNRALRDGKLEDGISIYYAEDHEIPLYGENVYLSEIKGYHSTISNEWLEEIIPEMLSCGEIEICKKRQSPLLLTDMNSYFENYGHTIVDNLEKELKPLSPIKGSVDSLALVNKRLYPQQAALVNGVNALFKNANTAIINGGMGVGKTLMGASIIETYFVDQYLKSHPKLNLKDVYLNPNCINYRVIIMCPGHLIEKWADECRKEIPCARVTILNDLSQLVKIKANGIKRDGREFFVIGKDFCKLSYSFRPIPTKVASRRRPTFVCTECDQIGDLDAYRKNKVCKCGNNQWKKVHFFTSDSERGLICPECDEVIHVGTEIAKPLLFANMTDLNVSCPICGCRLWAPDVKNLDDMCNIKPRKEAWYKISHFKNRAKNSRDTSWVLKGFESQLYEEKGIRYSSSKQLPDGVELVSRNKSRKYAPSMYMKNQLRGFFDLAIFDELHTYKGGNTAQGHAMHAITRASKKCIGLTGTIAGGVASHLFYIFYRLFPQLMKKHGYDYSDETAFINKYGTLETDYEVTSSSYIGIRNSSSRGRKLSEPKVKPGISPLVFPDFLISRTLFLDLSDMSNHLPMLKEQVISVPMNDEIRGEYRSVIGKLKGHGGLNSLSSSMLQFSLAYPDKPFGYGDIIDPKTGMIASRPRDFGEEYSDALLPKEEKLVELILSEQKEGRNCFVYCEYTGSEKQKITGRLKTIIEDYCGLQNKVTILESASPAPLKREEWIRKKASEGTRVFICNPRCVETGLDFCFNYNGDYYNYPTIIFYQLGCNLFTLWQASRRHYRLIQRTECRTYYMCYGGTNQETVIKLMADKQCATNALQGKFSMEGLASMANGIDPRVALVNNLLNDAYDEDHSDEVAKRFAAMNEVVTQDESIYGDKRTLLLREVIGEEETKKMLGEDDEQQEFIDLFETTLQTTHTDSLLVHTDKDTGSDNLFSMLDCDFNTFEEMFELGSDVSVKTEELKVVEEVKPKKMLKKQESNQISLFDIL